MAKDMAQKRTRRTEREVAQERYEATRSRLAAKEGQLGDARAKMGKLSKEVDELRALAEWWASNPLVESDQLTLD